jgi:hypothetical protein
MSEPSIMKEFSTSPASGVKRGVKVGLVRRRTAQDVSALTKVMSYDRQNTNHTYQDTVF